MSGDLPQNEPQPLEVDTSVTDVGNVVERHRRVSAYLIIIASKVPGLLGKMVKIDREEMVIGRAEDAQLQIEDKGVSRRHARIMHYGEDRFQLEDMHSTNGTLYNGEKIEKATLKDGDKIQVGSNVILKFSMQDQLDEKYQRTLYESVVRDGLTGLYNRKFLLEALEKEMAYASRHDVPLSVVMIDLDHFKMVNDTHGHVAGDQVLVQTSKVLSETTRIEDVVARYGGEEFALLLRDTNLDEGARCAERVRQAIANAQVDLGTKSLKVTASFGVALYRVDMTAETLLQQADQALYRAKALGRNRVERAVEDPAAPSRG